MWNAEEPEYETVELAKPVRTDWSIGAGLTLWTISVAAVTSLLLLGATKNGDEWWMKIYKVIAICIKHMKTQKMISISNNILF